MKERLRILNGELQHRQRSIPVANLQHSVVGGGDNLSVRQHVTVGAKENPLVASKEAVVTVPEVSQNGKKIQKEKSKNNVFSKSVHKEYIYLKEEIRKHEELEKKKDEKVFNKIRTQQRDAKKEKGSVFVNQSFGEFVQSDLFETAVKSSFEAQGLTDNILFGGEDNNPFKIFTAFLAAMPVEEIQSTFENASDAFTNENVQKFNVILNKLEQVCSDGGLLSKIEKIVDDPSTLLPKMTDASKNFLVKLVLGILLFGVSLYACINGTFSRIYSIATAFTGIASLLKYGDVITSYFKTFSMDENVAQAYESPYSVVVTAFMAFFSYVSKGKPMSFAEIRNLGKLPFVAGIVTEIASWEKKGKDVMSFLLKLGEIVAKLLDFCLVRWFGRTSFFKSKVANEDVNDWADKVEAIYELYHKGKLQITLYNAERVWSLQTERLTFNKIRLADRDEQRKLEQTLSFYDRILRDILKPFHGISQSNGGLRAEPTCVIFTGPPGVGKTYMNQHFAQEIIKSTISREEAKAFRLRTSDYIYNRNPETEYWDGYNGQYVCYYDEFGQQIEVPGGNSVCMEIIRNVNTHPHMLHMADIESKGNKYFRSQIILGTTNLKKIDFSHVIADVEAFKRRVTFLYMVPKIEYSTSQTAGGSIEDRRLDRSKLREVMELDIYDIYECTYDEHNFLRPKPDTRMSYEDCIEYVKKMHADKQQKATDYIMALRQKLEEEPEESVEEPLPSVEEAFDIHMSSMSDVENAPGNAEVAFLDTTFRRRCREFCEHMPKTEFDVSLNIVWAHWHANERHRINFFGYFSVVMEQYMVARDRGEGLIFAAWFYREFVASEGWFKKTPVLAGKFKEAKAFMLDKVFRAGTFLAEGKADFVVTAATHFLVATLAYFATSSLLKAIAAAIDLMRNFFSEKSVGESMEIHRVDPRFRKARSYRGARKIISQGCSDVNSYNLLKSVFDHNSYSMFVMNKDNEVKGLGTAHFIHGSCLLIPNHFVHLIAADDGVVKVILQPVRVDSATEYSFEKDSFLKRLRVDDDLVKRDLCFVDLDGFVPRHRTRLNNFVSEKVLRHKNMVEVCLAVPDDDGIQYMHGQAKLLDSLGVHYENGQQKLESVLQYNIPTTHGDCGAPLFIINGSITDGKWMGIHVAGMTNKSLGVSSMITREYLTRKFDELIGQNDSSHYLNQSGKEYKIAVMEKNPFPFEHNFEIIGKTDTPVHRNRKSNIVPSKLQESAGDLKPYFEPLKKPAKLAPSKGDPPEKDPLYLSLEKYGKPKPQLDKTLVSLAVQSLKNKLYNTPFEEQRLYVKRGVLTFEDAIIGFPGDPLFQPIPRSTSAGYPFVQMNKGKGKYPYFGTDETYDLTTPLALELKLRCEEQVEMLKRGEEVMWVFTDTLKDELRPKEKVEAGKTRLFTACPLDLLIVCREYFLDFCAFLQNNRINNGVCIGVNVYSAEWDLLAKMLASKGNNCIAGDFSGFDSCQDSSVYYEILDHIIQPFYDDGEENARIRRGIFDGLFKSFHVCGDIIYRWHMNMVSGCPLTAVLNSLYSLVLLRMVYMKSKPNPYVAALVYNEQVYDAAYGDDHVASVSDEDAECFNQVTISQIMPELGMNYTLETKEGIEIVDKFRSITEISFLKRRFMFCSAMGRVVAPLDLNTVLEIPLWHKKTDDFEIFKQIIDHVLMELSLHGNKVFSEWSVKLLKCVLHHYGYIPSVVSWNAWIEIIRSRS